MAAALVVLPQRQHVDAVLDRHHAVGQGTHAVALVHGRGFGEVPGRLLERHLVDPKIGVGQAAELG
jgi:hypothetical protein